MRSPAIFVRIGFWGLFEYVVTIATDCYTWTSINCNSPCVGRYYAACLACGLRRKLIAIDARKGQGFNAASCQASDIGAQ